MKSSFVLKAAQAICFVALSFSAHANADQQIESRDVVIGISDAFIPGGFDSEADAYVVVNGVFPNSCYRWKTADVKSVTNFNHEIRSVASVSQGMCLMVMVPFTKQVRLGQLDSGNHKLKFVNGDGTYLVKELKVE